MTISMSKMKIDFKKSFSTLLSFSLSYRFRFYRFPSLKGRRSEKKNVEYISLVLSSSLWSGKNGR